MSARLSVLLVDDDERFRERLALALRERGYDVVTAEGPNATWSELARTQVGAVVTDLKMPGVGGLNFVRSLCERLPQARIVVLTGYGTIATAVEAMRVGAVDYLVKPCHVDQLAVVLEGRGPQDPEAAPSVSGHAEPFDSIPSLARLEREHIERVLVECGGNVSKAARVLGIHRRTLQYKLSKFPESR